jgi:hypothetical protein
MVRREASPSGVVKVPEIRVRASGTPYTVNSSYCGSSSIAQPVSDVRRSFSNPESATLCGGAYENCLTDMPSPNTVPPPKNSSTILLDRSVASGAVDMSDFINGRKVIVYG